MIFFRKNVVTVSLLNLALVMVSACGPKSADENAQDDPTQQTNPSQDPNKTNPTAPATRSGGFPVDTNSAANSPPTRGEDVAGPASDATVSNLQEIIDQLNLGRYHARGFRGQNLKIAIFDNGFTGYESSLGTRLPPDTKLLAGNGSMQATNHGLKLAELIYGLATGDSTYSQNKLGPKIFLVNTNGFSNLTQAIDQAIAHDVDMILYAQVWEYGGNFNGAGFINDQVRRATRAGIQWINAAGNFGKSSFVSAIEVDRGFDVRLPFQNAVRLRVPNLGVNALPVRIVLAWNDFSESKNYRTPQDLDLVVTDDRGNEVAASRLIQDGQDHGQDTRYSAHAREIVRANLAPGTYFLKVQAMSRNFDRDSLLRIAADGPGLEILDQPAIDTVLIPADNPTVLTVGANDVDYSASNRAGKPELKTISRLVFSDGTRIDGTSAASAIAAGALAVYQSARGFMSHHEVITTFPGKDLKLP